jgi:hypothetical protein
MNGDFDDVDTALSLVDIDKMRFHVINCLIALHLVVTEKITKEAILCNDDYELVKGKVFNATISMIIDDKFDSDEVVVKSILSGFPIPDENKMSDERSWLPQHFAVALGVKNKICEYDVRIMLSVDLLAMHRLNKKEADAFIMCDESGRCALHLVAQYSESIDLLQDILRIDHKMTKMVCEIEDTGEGIIPLGLLCRRSHFATFDEMVSCLIEVDSSVRVVFNGTSKHLGSYEECLYQDILPGSRGAKSLILLRTLFEANPAVVKYDDSDIIQSVCCYLRGELGVSVLSLFLSKESSGLKALKNDGC